MALLATYPLMTISTMQATRGKRPAVSAAEAGPPGTPGADGQPLLKRLKDRRPGALADIAEVGLP